MPGLNEKMNEMAASHENSSSDEDNQHVAITGAGPDNVRGASGDGTVTSVEDLLQKLDLGRNELDKDLAKNSISLNHLLLLFGNTGDGKSTLRRLLSGEVDDLWVKGKEHCIVVANTDDNRGGDIGDGAGGSCTIAPRSFSIPGSEMTGIDNPGWDDTRGAFNELLNMQLLSRAANQAERMKFLIVAEFSSIKEGTSLKRRRDNFKNAMRIIRHFPDSDKSVGLVVTKVDNEQEQDDNKVVQDVVELLKKDLKKVDDPSEKELIEQLIEAQNIFLVRKPHKDKNIEKVPLKQVLVDPLNPRRGLYHQDVCQGLLEFCKKLNYVQKGADTSLRVSCSNDANGQLITTVFPKLLEKIKVHFNPLVDDALAKIEAIAKSTKKEEEEDSSTFLKLVEALNMLRVEHSPNQEWSLSQILENLAKLFDFTLKTKQLDGLANAENHFRELDNMTEIPAVTGVKYSGTADKIKILTDKLIELQENFDEGKQNGIRVALKRRIGEGINRQISSLESAYQQRHEALVNSDVLRGLAFKKLEDHVEALKVIWDEKQLDKSNPMEGFQLLYQKFGLPLADKETIEGLQKLAVEHGGIKKLGGQEYYPQKVLERLPKFLAELQRSVPPKQWMGDIQQQVGADIQFILESCQNPTVYQWSSDAWSCGFVDTAIARLSSHNSQLEQYLAELTEKLETPDQLEMEVEISHFCEILGMEHAGTLFAGILRGQKWLKETEASGGVLKEGVSNLANNRKELLACYQYLKDLRKVCGESYEVQGRARQYQEKGVGGKMDANLLLTDIQNLTGFRERPRGLEKILGGEMEPKVVGDLFHQAFDCKFLDHNNDTLVMFGTGNVAFQNCEEFQHRNMYLLAGDTVFVDKTLISQSANILFIGGKAVQCMGLPKIVLQGTSGADPLPAVNGKTWSADGKDGDPGSEGGTGGNVYLFTENVLNCPDLLVASVGGRGGPGQDGGDGHDGTPDKRSIDYLCSYVNGNLILFDEDFKSICDHFYFTRPSSLLLAQASDLTSAESYEPMVTKLQQRFNLVEILKIVLHFLLTHLDRDDILTKHCFCGPFQEITSPNVGNQELEYLLEDSLGDEACGAVCEVVTHLRRKDDKWRDTVLQKTESQFPMTNDYAGVRFPIIMEWSNRASKAIRILHEDLIVGTPPSQNHELSSSDGGTTQASKSTNKGGGGKGGEGGVRGCPGKIVVHSGRGEQWKLKEVRRHGFPGIRGFDGNKRKVAHQDTRDGLNNLTSSDSACEQCPTGSDLSEVVEPLLEYLKLPGDPGQQFQLFSTLATHDWAMEHVLTTETFVTAYQNLLLLHCQRGPFTERRLEVEQEFQKHLRTFQSVRELGAEEDHVITILLASSQLLTENIQRFKNAPKLIYDLKAELKHSRDRLEELHHSKKIVEWTDNHLSFQKLLEEKIRQTKVSLNKDVRDAVEGIRRGFQQHMETLEEELRTCEKLLEERAFYERGEKIVQAVGLLLSVPFAFLLPMVAPAGTSKISMAKYTVKASSCLANIFKELKPDWMAPPAVTLNELNNRKCLWLKLQNSVQRQRELLEEAICLEPKLKLSFGKFLKKLEKVREELTSCKIARDGWLTKVKGAVGLGPKEKADSEKIHLQNLLACLEQLDKIRGEIFEELDAKRNACTKDKHKELKSRLDILKHDLSMMDWDDTLFKKTKGGSLEAIKEFFLRQKNIDLAKERRRNVQAKYVPEIDELVTWVQVFLEAEDGPGEGTSLWKFKDVLGNAKNYLKGFVEKLPSEKGLLDSFKKIDRALDMHIEAWECIRKYRDDKDTAAFMARACSADVNYSSLEIGEELKSKLSKIQFLVYAHLLLMRFQGTKNAFEQWCFPYAERYLETKKPDIDQVEGLFSGELGKLAEDRILDKVVEMAGKAAGIVKYFGDEYGESVCRREKKDDVWTQLKFLGSVFVETEVQPLFTWKAGEWRDSIWKLFSGLPVLFKADPRGEPKKKAAVKVNKNVDLRFIYTGGTQARADYQEALNKRLGKCRLEMTFHGNSLYRVEEDYYILQGDKITLFGNVATGENIDRADAIENNDSRTKMKDFVISPYGTWTFKLVSADNRQNGKAAFEELADMFGHCVDIELVGMGYYLNEEITGWDNEKPRNVGRYYAPVNWEEYSGGAMTGRESP